MLSRVWNRTRALRQRPVQTGFPVVLADNQGDVLIHLSPMLVRTHVSPSSYDIMGYKPDELIGDVPYDIVHPQDWTRIRPLLALCQRTGRPVRDTHRVRHKNGQIMWMEGCYTVGEGGRFAILLHRIAFEPRQG